MPAGNVWLVWSQGARDGDGMERAWKQTQAF